MAIITGTSLDDVLLTTVDADAVSAQGGNDVILVGTAAHDAGETINGSSGWDRLWFTSTAGGETLVLLAGVTQVEEVLIANAVGATTGAAAINLDASAVLTGLVLSGNNGANLITGTAKNDVIVGGGGQDTLNGGAGADRIAISLDEATLDTADGGAATEGNTLILIGEAAGAVLIDLTLADQVDGAGIQSNFTHVDASNVTGEGVIVTSSALANNIVGSAQDDVFIVAAQAHHTSSDLISGGTQLEDSETGDIIRFTSTVANEKLALGSKIFGVETVEIADAAGDTTGTTALRVDATLVKSKLNIVGNDGANQILGSAFDDHINGNDGADDLRGGKGNDRYVFDEGDDGDALEKITDAEGEDDFIVFTSTTGGDTLVLGATVGGIEGIYLSEDATEEDLDLSGTAAVHVNAAIATKGLAFFGNDGANSLTGGLGNDTFEGGGGVDSIFGGTGKDEVVMDAAELDDADAGRASEGNTLRLTGAAASQILVDLSVAENLDQVDGGGIQSDFTHVDAAAMEGNGITVTGSSRTNEITGSAQNDIFIFARKTDLVTSAGISDILDGGTELEDTDGDIIRFTSITNDESFTITDKIAGIERVEISDAAGATTGTARVHVNASKAVNKLYILGNNGRNSMLGSSGDDTLNGGDGNDTLKGGTGNDSYEIDSLTDYDNGDQITDAGTEVGDNDRVLFSSENDGDILILRSSGISGIETFETAEGTANIGINGDAHKFAAKFLGNEGNNALTGTDFNDTIEGGLGTDTIFGGAGADRIYQNVDGPQDEIHAGAMSEKNTLALKLPDDEFGFVSIDLSAADQIFGGPIQEGFLHVDASEMTNKDNFVSITGTSGANSIIGSGGADTFRPGLGNDTVEGGSGADTWIITSQQEYDGDLYSDTGSTRDDFIQFDSTEDGLTLRIRNNVFGVDAAGAGANSFTSTAHLHLDAREVDQPFGLAGNLGNNKLQSTRHGESLFDVGGADTMLGGGGQDDYTLLSFAGWILDVPGSAPFDIIDDTGIEIDDFYFADEASSATLVIGNNVSGVERFVISKGDLSPGGPFVRDNTSTNNAGIDAHHIDHKIVLAGNDGSNVLIATGFNDTIEGFKGSDTIEAGAGKDLVTMDVTDGIVDAINAGALGEENMLILKGAAPAIVRFDLRSGTDQLTGIGGAGEALIQIGFRHVDAAAVTDNGVQVFGSSAANKITGSSQDDVLEGGAGKDVVVGGGGNDAIVLRDIAHQVSDEKVDAGEGEEDAVWFAWASGTKTLTLNPTAFLNVEKIVAANDLGQTTGADALNLNASLFTKGMKLVGNNGVNKLTGTAKNDVLTGNGGADTLTGGLGNDVYLYDDASDGHASERITDTGGSADILRFTSTVTDAMLTIGSNVTGLDFVELSDKDGVLTGTHEIGVNASAVTIRLRFRGNEGVNEITGGSGNDTIVGAGGQDVIVAGGGADLIEMGIELDTRDDVNAGLRSEGNTLVVKGEAPGIMVWDLSSDTDQLVSINAGDDSKVITGVTHLDLSAVTEAAATITGSAEVNRITGTKMNDTFVMLEVSQFGVGETLTGGDGVDRLIVSATVGGDLILTTKVTGIEEVLVGDGTGDTSGTAAVNVNAAVIKNALKIEGNDGNNVITGSAFNDQIIGNAGADTIVAGKGADKVKTDIEDEDAINAGLLSEGNEWILEGAATGPITFDLSVEGDQVVGGLVQSGFSHLDARDLTGTGGITVVGSAVANRIAGTEDVDTINAGLGADVVTMDAGNYDIIDAGALGEENELVLIGGAPGNFTINLSIAGDQLTTGTGNQSGFAHVNAAAMTGGAVIVTGSDGANRIAGTSSQDTINAGAGADVVTMNITSSYDVIDAGAGSEGDMLRLTGSAAGLVTVNLGVAPGADQLTLVGAGAEAVVQSGFQHVDASAILDFGVELHGSGANNILTGTALTDRFIGRAGSDTIDLGVDSVSDEIVYEKVSDGVRSTGTSVSRDRILHFESGVDEVKLAGDFNGGSANLDDIGEDDDAMFFANDEKANFTTTHEGLFISAEKAKLSDSALYSGSLASVVERINAVGATGVAGDDGLILVQGKTTTGVYYYQELGGSGVSASELTLLGIIDSHAVANDFGLGVL